MNCFASQARRTVASHGGRGFMLDERLQSAEFDKGGKVMNLLLWHDSGSRNWWEVEGGKLPSLCRILFV